MEEFLRNNFGLLMWISIAGNVLAILAYILYKAARGKRV